MRWGYLNLFLLIILIVLLSQLEGGSVLSVSTKIDPIPTATLIPTPIQAPPQSLLIPKLTLNANIEPVGINGGMQMAIPNDFTHIGWYILGVKPGEEGTAILAGHYDDQTGQPAIFYELNQLETGDMVEVVDNNGKNLQFTVTTKQAYSAFTVIDELINRETGKNLVLITCSGWWDSSIASYSHRLVVYATLK